MGDVAIAISIFQRKKEGINLIVSSEKQDNSMLI
jgi:hypothetical protein